jgi:hypothetical protein
MDASEMKRMKDEITVEISKNKTALYKEEAKSALFAALFAANISIIFLYPFTLLTMLNVFVAIYMVGFLKPTIKRQTHLHGIIESLKDLLNKAENPPEPKKPASPWKT